MVGFGFEEFSNKEYDRQISNRDCDALLFVSVSLDKRSIITDLKELQQMFINDKNWKNIKQKE